MYHNLRIKLNQIKIVIRVNELIYKKNITLKIYF